MNKIFNKDMDIGSIIFYSILFAITITAFLITVNILISVFDESENNSTPVNLFGIPIICMVLAATLFMFLATLFQFFERTKNWIFPDSFENSSSIDYDSLERKFKL